VVPQFESGELLGTAVSGLQLEPRNVRTILMRIYIALCAFFFQTEAFPKAPPAFASRISYGVY
jgi:hypothetical protein